MRYNRGMVLRWRKNGEHIPYSSLPIGGAVAVGGESLFVRCHAHALARGGGRIWTITFASQYDKVCFERAVSPNALFDGE